MVSPALTVSPSRTLDLQNAARGFRRDGGIVTFDAAAQHHDVVGHLRIGEIASPDEERRHAENEQNQREHLPARALRRGGAGAAGLWERLSWSVISSFFVFRRPVVRVAARRHGTEVCEREIGDVRRDLGRFAPESFRVRATAARLRGASASSEPPARSRCARKAASCRVRAEDRACARSIHRNARKSAASSRRSRLDMAGVGCANSCIIRRNCQPGRSARQTLCTIAKISSRSASSGGAALWIAFWRIPSLEAPIDAAGLRYRAPACRRNDS